MVEQNMVEQKPMVKQKPQLMKAVARIQPKTILVVGDLILDRYTYGVSKRISPEAPVPVVLVEKEDVRAGGVGNVALNLVALGMRPRIVSRVGDDNDGVELKNILESSGVDCRFLMIDRGAKTSVKRRIIAGSQQLLRVDDERCDTLIRGVEDALLASVDSFLEEVSLVAISDYAKGALSDRLLQAIIRKAQEKNIPCITDPKGSDFRKYSGSTIIKPNLSEAMSVFGGGFADVAQASRAIFTQVDVEKLVVTRSEKGISLYCRDGREEHYPVMPKEVRDVTGAGDTVLATLSACLASSIALEEAIPIANIAASCVIERLGCATITLHDIMFRILQESAHGKVCGHDALTALIESLGSENVMVLHLSDAQRISHDQIMRLHHALQIEQPSKKIVVAYLKDENPDEGLVEFLASLQRVDLVALDSVQKNSEQTSLFSSLQTVHI